MPIKKLCPHLFSILLIALLFSVAIPCSALEVTYPSIFGQLNSGSTFPQYVLYIFNFLIGTAAILSLISFAVGAIGMISPNPESHSNAKDRMMGALLGLALTLSSFLIITTINPALKNISLAPLPTITITPPPVSPGVYFYYNPDCSGTNFMGPETSSTDDLSEGIQSMKIINGPVGVGPIYEVILHKSIGLDNGGECTEPIFFTQDCSSAASNCCQPLANLITPGSADIFTLRDYAKYQPPAIFIGGSFGGGGGENQNTSTPNPYYIIPGSVTFYSQPFGWDTNKSSSSVKIPSSPKEGGVIPSSTQADKMKLSYVGSNEISSEEQKCDTFQDCQGSIGTNGEDFIIALYSKTALPGTPCPTGNECRGAERCTNGVCVQDCTTSTACAGLKTCDASSGTCLDFTGAPYCKTFDTINNTDPKGIPNLSTEPILPTGNSKLDHVYVIPIN